MRGRTQGKKLREAALRWFAGGRKRDHEGIASQLERFGAPDEAVEAARDGPADDGALELHADCVAAVELFVRCGTQWAVHGFSGQLIGLRYEAVEAAARMSGASMTAEMLDDLRVMEGAVLAEAARRAPAGKARR